MFGLEHNERKKGSWEWGKMTSSVPARQKRRIQQAASVFIEIIYRPCDKNER